MESIVVSAYVISTHSYGESDLIVSLFSEEKGKIKAIAKGAKRSKKRFVNVLEPFSLIKAEINISRTSSLYLLKDAELIKDSSFLAYDPLKFAHASLALELVELWLKEEDKNRNIFLLLSWFLKNLANSFDFDYLRISLFFQVKILIYSGYYPDIEKCIKCPTGKLHNISIKAISSGNCDSCYKEEGVKVSLGALMTFLRIYEWDLEHLLRIKMSKKIMLECWLLIINLHATYLNFMPHSYYVLKRLDSFFSSIFKRIF